MQAIVEPASVKSRTRAASSPEAALESNATWAQAPRSALRGTLSSLAPTGNASPEPGRHYANLVVGDHCYIGRDVLLDLRDQITFGDYVTISMRCSPERC